jgi:SAM-dependent methyltransferase
MAKIFGTIESASNQGGGDIASSLLGGIFQFRGWEVHDEPAESVIEVLIDGQPAQSWTERSPRPDIDAAHPDLASINPLPGFRVTANSLGFENGRHTLTCEARCERDKAVLGTYEVVIANGPEFDVYKHAHVDPREHRDFAKLEKIVDLLQCPHCGGGMELRSGPTISCLKCTRQLATRNFAAIMVGNNPEYPIEEGALSSPASNNLYPAPILRQLAQVVSNGGLALDVGSGRRGFGFPQLVQLEICAYPHTDVVNQSDTLPFRDSSFDFIFALAVTEHVRRPWVLASEMQRVLKKGGAIHVDSAFLQPIHGYPSHYFNMTGVALQGLFDEIEASFLAPEPYQHPWFALNWILDHAVADIAPAQRKVLSEMKFEDVLGALKDYVAKQTGIFADISLPSGRVDELAAGFTLIGRKREETSKAGDPEVPTAARLREIADSLNYSDASLTVRFSRRAILLSHYWYWTKVHWRNEGSKAVMKRIVSHLGLHRSE